MRVAAPMDKARWAIGGALVIGALTLLDLFGVHYTATSTAITRFGLVTVPVDCGNGWEVMTGTDAVSGCGDHKGVVAGRFVVGAGLAFALYQWSRRLAGSSADEALGAVPYDGRPDQASGTDDINPVATPGDATYVPRPIGIVADHIQAVLTSYVVHRRFQTPGPALRSAVTDSMNSDHASTVLSFIDGQQDGVFGAGAGDEFHQMLLDQCEDLHRRISGFGETTRRPSKHGRPKADRPAGVAPPTPQPARTGAHPSGFRTPPRVPNPY